jgi:hypothetical protein
VRCGRCGNDNAEANRFCGMCGAALVAKTQAAGHSPGQGPAGAAAGHAAAPRQAPVPVQFVPVQSVPERAPLSSSDAGPNTRPIITGPSFLGLNTPVAGAGGGHAGDPQAGRDPRQRSSGNLDYLLEDEEEPKRGWGKLLLVVVALALAVGFGYLHWKQGGFDWLNASEKKPAAAAKPTADAARSGADSGGTTGSAATPDGAASDAGANGTATAPATGGAAASPAESTAPQAIPSQATSPAASSQAQPSDSDLPGDSASPTAGSDSHTQSLLEEPPAGPKAGTRKAAAAKPVAAKPVDPVTEAERYIYGRGVRQDCDHGMRLLKPAAEQSHPNAMISLGALYSTGTCAPRDLPSAYRWFALALHKQPDNQPLQDDLQKLWSQMTQPERQLAIKLSQ